MTMLAVPSRSSTPPSSAPPAANPVSSAVNQRSVAPFRPTWRHCLYTALGAGWFVTLAAFVLAPEPVALHWWALLVYGVPAIVLMDYSVSGTWLETEPAQATATHRPCCGCGELWPRQELRVDDGFWCPWCPTAPVSIELDNDLPKEAA